MIISCLQYVPPKDIPMILSSVGNLLTGDRIIIAFMDLSDNYSHEDKSLPPINFLRYTAEEWSRIAGARFNYQNRLRITQYYELFENAGIEILVRREHINSAMTDLLQDGFLIDEKYKRFSPEELATTHAWICGRFR